MRRGGRGGNGPERVHCELDALDGEPRFYPLFELIEQHRLQLGLANRVREVGERGEALVLEHGHHGLDVGFVHVGALQPLAYVVAHCCGWCATAHRGPQQVSVADSCEDTL
eukprot:3585319-Prymnesium_polylepis.1